MPPRLYVFMGLIASGKSTLAQAFAKEFSFPYYNSDVVRKELAGKSPSSRQGAGLNQGIYTPEFSRLTYEALLDHASRELASMRSVVLDGSYQSRSERQRIIDCATRCKAFFSFILCQCDDDETRRRLEKRSLDPNAVSDGTWQIYQRQRESFHYPDEIDPLNFYLIDTAKPIPELTEELRRHFSLPQ
ncbi:MAG: AAA family ATPase [Desulfobulbaceae bacterium]|nr:AAA family ATPase [Desulfobulbaceae bacterium]